MAIDAIKKTREPLTLKANNCDLFNVTVELNEKDFLRDSFTKALPSEDLSAIFEERRSLRVSCGRQSKKIDYRAGVDIHPYEEKSDSPKVHFHVILEPTTTLLKKEEKPPFAEEIFRWLYGFISDNASIGLIERAEFAFPTVDYRSAFSLPLLMSGTLNPIENEIFEGSQIIGMSIRLQANKAGVQFAEQRLSKKTITVRLIREAETTAQKLMTIESDIPVLHAIALSTLRSTRRTRNDTRKRFSGST